MLSSIDSALPVLQDAQSQGSVPFNEIVAVEKLVGERSSKHHCFSLAVAGSKYQHDRASRAISLTCSYMHQYTCVMVRERQSLSASR